MRADHGGSGCVWVTRGVRRYVKTAEPCIRNAHFPAAARGGISSFPWSTNRYQAVTELLSTAISA
jgi:hypothetical protein